MLATELLLANMGLICRLLTKRITNNSGNLQDNTNTHRTITEQVSSCEAPLQIFCRLVISPPDKILLYTAMYVDPVRLGVPNKVSQVKTIF